MTLNARQSKADSLQINVDKISKTVKNSTVKPRNFSLHIYQKRPEILPVYIKERLTLYSVYH